MSSKTAKLVLKKHKKLDKIYHPDTGLVFKSATEKVVVGRIVDDDFVELDEEALQLCEQNHFKVDESLLETEEAEEQPEEEKKTSKKKSAEGAVDEDEVEEETPKPKKGSQPVRKEVEEKPTKPKKESAKETSKETSKEQPKDSVKAECLDGFSVILARHTKELQDYVSGRQTEVQADKERIVDLEKQLATSKKDLEEARAKLKKLLAAMQSDL